MKKDVDTLLAQNKWTGNLFLTQLFSIDAEQMLKRIEIVKQEAAAKRREILHTMQVLQVRIFLQVF